MNATEVYLHLAVVCERAAVTALLPEAKVGMLASAAAWRRLAASFRPWEEVESIPNGTSSPNRSVPWKNWTRSC
jgi:hypothetical protein